MRSAELTELAIAWLREQHPDAYVTIELSVAEWGGASVDVAAITSSEVVGVEVKGEGDSPSRLELQGLKYGRVCKHMWLLPTPDGTLGSRCDKKKPAGWGRLGLVDGKVENIGPRASDQPHLCAMAMCETLWRDELYELAKIGDVHVAGGKRPNVTNLRSSIVESLPTPRIHDLMIERLRARTWQPGKRVIAPTLDAATICAPCHGTGLWQGGNAAQMGLNVQDVSCGHCRGTGKAVGHE